MPRFPGFVGPSYTSQSPNVDMEQTMNWYPEHAEADGKFPMYPTPGLKLAYSLAESAIMGLFTFNGRVFAASKSLWELFSDGTSINRGTLAAATPLTPVTFAANQGNQILVCASGALFVLNTFTNAFTAVNMGQFQGAVTQIGFSDGFFVALIQNSSVFQLSALEDGTTWSGLDVNKVSVFPDNIISMQVAFRQPWFLGAKSSVPYYNSGASSTPYLPIPNVLLEQGCGAQYATVVMDNTLFWVGADERGNGVAWRANGYTPARISTHAVEFAWQGYSTISDAVAFAYQDQGHTFWQIYFPTANKTWVYDAATNLWHERALWSGSTFSAHRARCHTEGFGKHLVGDRLTGTVFTMSTTLVDDNGSTIRRLRRAPPLAQDDNTWLMHSRLEVYAETGLGPIPPLLDGNGNPRGPQMMLRWSDDGHTWSNIYTADCGQGGNFKTRALWRRLGRSRHRHYEISVTDPIPWRVVDAFLMTESGIQGA